MREVVMPAEVVARMDRATTELAASRILTEVAVLGSRAPAFVLPDAVGEEVSLDRLLARGPVVISFYRGVWCPFCNLEQRALQQNLPQITALGASLVAISGMTPDHPSPPPSWWTPAASSDSRTRTRTTCTVPTRPTYSPPWPRWRRSRLGGTRRRPWKTRLKRAGLAKMFAGAAAQISGSNRGDH
jgi:hypothetical protein